jgi:predicted ATPase
MLTRLKIKGFKNLADVDIRFGPFTCIAGVNGAGKSNLFDAIRFLSALTNQSLVEAALTVREENGRGGDIRDLFHRVGEDFVQESMSFEVEMIIPSEGKDDLGGTAEAATTFVNYILELGYHSDRLGLGGLSIRREILNYIPRSRLNDHLLFKHANAWHKSAIKGRRGAPFISTEKDRETGQALIKLHQDGSSGSPSSRPAANLPRTVLSSINTAEFPTALLARREMQSWRLLQLEPAILRRPDEFTASPEIGPDGAHLAATLFSLAGRFGEDVYVRVSNSLAQLLDDVRDVWVERDEQRRLLTLQVRMKDGTVHPAKALSDGTLRFLALATIKEFSESHSLLCLEEPENGIHPSRIPAILTLLQDIAVDADEKVSADNPLRQVIINTHSPLVVQGVQENDVLGVQLRESSYEGRRFQAASFMGLSKTWRDNGEAPTLPLGDLTAYLAGVEPAPPSQDAPPTKRRVRDREDVQELVASEQLKLL